MGKTTKTPQQEPSQEPVKQPVAPVVQSPLAGPVLSMQNQYGNSFAQNQMCGPMNPFGAGPYAQQPPPGQPAPWRGPPWAMPTQTGAPNSPLRGPSAQTPTQVPTQQNPQVSTTGPGATQTGTLPTTNPAQQPPAQQQVNMEAVRAKSDALFKAMDGWGTDEAGVMNALKGMSSAELDALKKEYQDHYGRSLDDDITGELSGADLEEAQAHMKGNKVDSAIAALNNSTGFFNDDEAKIEETLRGLKPEELQQLQAKMGSDPKVKAVLDNVGSALGGSDKEVFDSLMKGDTSTADAIRMDDAMGSSKSAWNPMSWGTDEEGVYKLMEGKSAEERAAMEKAFNERMAKAGKDTTLRGQFEEEFSGAQKDIATSLVDGDQVGANAARMKDAAEGMGTNEEAIYGLLEGKSPEDRKALIESYEKKYGSLDAMLDDELGGNDRERAKQLKETGALDPTFALNIAMEGMGTDEALIRKTLQGKTPDQAKAIADAYKAKYGRELSTDLGDELSGRDHFEVGLALEGEPQDSKAQLERARKVYEFERGSGSTGFSRMMMDGAEMLGMTSKGSQLDRQMERMNGMFDETGKLKPGYTDADVNKVYNYEQTDAQNYKEAKDSVTDALATGAEITAAAVATVLTDGAASPWLIAAIAGAAGGTAAMAVKMGMQGDAYGREALYGDLANIGVSALSGGLGEAAFVGNKIDDIAKHTGELIKVFGGPAAQEILKNGIKSAGQEGLKGLFQGAMNDKAWDAGMDQWLLSTGAGLGKGMLTGGAGGLAQQGVKTSFGFQTPFMKSVGVDALAGSAQGLASTAVDTNTWTGSPEDMFMNLAKGTAKGTFSGAVQGAADRQIRAGKLEYQIRNGADPASLGPEMMALNADEQSRVVAAMLDTQVKNTTLSGEISISQRDDSNKTVVLNDSEGPGKKAAAVTPDDDGAVKVTTTGDDGSAKTTSADAGTVKHPDVQALEAVLATNKAGLIKDHLTALTSGAHDDALLNVAVTLPEMLKNGSLTPEQINTIGKHLFAEGHQLDALLRNGKKTGQDDGINQYQKLTDAEAANVKAQRERSALMAKDWSDTLAAQQMDPFGNKIDQTVSITQEDHKTLSPLVKNIQKQTGAWTDMDLPSTMWSYDGNINRYKDSHVHLVGGEDGVRTFGKNRDGSAKMNNDGTMSTSVTANEVQVGRSVQFHGPGAQADGYNMMLNPGYDGYGTPGFNANLPNLKLGNQDMSIGWMLWSWQNKVNNKSSSNPTK